MSKLNKSPKRFACNEHIYIKMNPWPKYMKIIWQPEKVTLSKENYEQITRCDQNVPFLLA